MSFDGGVSYQTISRGTLLETGIGEAIVVKLTLSENTQINSLVVQYSMKT